MLQPELWPAMIDPTQIELVILNLAINARDAMEVGGTLTVETANVDPGAAGAPEEPAAGDYVMVAVTDTGIGMTPEVLAKAFEPFFTTKEVGKGSASASARFRPRQTVRRRGAHRQRPARAPRCGCSCRKAAASPCAEPQGRPPPSRARQGPQRPAGRRRQRRARGHRRHAAGPGLPRDRGGQRRRGAGPAGPASADRPPAGRLRHARG